MSIRVKLIDIKQCQRKNKIQYVISTPNWVVSCILQRWYCFIYSEIKFKKEKQNRNKDKDQRKLPEAYSRLTRSQIHVSGKFVLTVSLIACSTWSKFFFETSPVKRKERIKNKCCNDTPMKSIFKHTCLV